MKRYKSGRTNRIPSIDGFESISAAPWVGTSCDVSDAYASNAVQPGIEETKWFPALRKEEVIKKRDYARRYLDIGS